MVSKASDDLPLPDSPVMTTRRSRGSVRSMFLRLCCRAPRISILSRGIKSARKAYPFRTCVPSRRFPVSMAANESRRRTIGDGSAHARGHGHLEAVQRGAVLPENLPLHALAETLEAQERVDALRPRRVVVRVIGREQDVVFQPIVDDAPGQVLTAVGDGVALAAEVLARSQGE